MKVLLIYYTGTYNTRFLTNLVKSEILEAGHEVSAVEISCNTPVVSTEGYDLVGLGYPIYAFNSPKPFNQYLKKLKFSPRQKYFIYKNSGETYALNNASSRVIKRRMRHKKAEFAGEYHFVMPYNIHFPYPDDLIREIFYYDEKLLKVMSYRLFNGMEHNVKANMFYHIASWAISVQKIGGFVNSFFYRVNKEKCTKCGLCVKTCPEGNIRLKKGKIKFGHSCDMCMRCSFYCPANAVKIGLLEGWKVNGGYRLNELWQGKTAEQRVITQDTEGFYKCLYPTFCKIQKEYEELFLNED